MALFDDLRTVVTDILNTQAPDLCNIERPGLVDDGRGGKSADYSAVNSTPISCLYEPLKGSDQLIASAPAGFTIYRVTLPAGTDVKGKDRIKVLARGSEPARTFEVSHVLQQMGVVIEVIGTLKG
jgi:hypothetical protein